MRKADYLSMGVLLILPFLIFYPLFTSEYLYTDEAVQLRLYRKGSDFQMFTSQGRYITEKLFQWLFSSIETIREVTYLRLFSFFGWLVSIPIWYVTLKKVIEREGLPRVLTFFSVLYMIAMPSFSMYVSWASCMELFLANTSGLLSGYFVYSGFYYKNDTRVLKWARLFLAIMFGLTSLFTYQTGFGCFVLPFVLHLLAVKKVDRTFWIGVVACFAIYLLYFLAFKVSVVAGGVQASERASVYINPVQKLIFILTRPLTGAFHFTLLMNERSIPGVILYLLIAGAWLFANLRLLKSRTLQERVLYFGALFFLLLCTYIPGLVVKENYASNRTLFALNLAVFFMVMETLFLLVTTKKMRIITVGVLSALFIANAWYNFRVLFLAPITAEYQQLRAYMNMAYSPNMHTVYFIRPQEDFFVRRYGITRSWDEFGVPSTFFDWVPEFWVKQVVLEQTGDCALSEKLVVKHWLGKEAYQKAGEPVAEGVLLVEVEQILSR